MVIIIDSNVFMSALIKEGITRKIITQCREKFIIPKYLFQEIRNYEGEIILKSGLSKEEYNPLLKTLLKYLIIIPNELVSSYIKEAEKIVKNIDIDDALFIATALAIENSVIWSNDKKLKNQNTVKIINTEEMIDMIFTG